MQNRRRTIATIYRTLDQSNTERLLELTNNHDLPGDVAQAILRDRLDTVEPAAFEALNDSLDGEAHRELMKRAASEPRHDLLHHALDHHWLGREQYPELIRSLIGAKEDHPPEEQLELADRIGAYVEDWTNEPDLKLLMRGAEPARIPRLLRSFMKDEYALGRINEVFRTRSIEGLKAMTDVGLGPAEALDSIGVLIKEAEAPHWSSDKFYRAVFDQFDWAEDELRQALDGAVSTGRVEPEWIAFFNQFLQSDYADQYPKLVDKLDKELQELLEQDDGQLGDFERQRLRLLLRVGLDPTNAGEESLKQIIDHAPPESIRSWIDENGELPTTGFYQLIEASVYRKGLIEIAMDEYEPDADQLERAVERYVRRIVEPADPQASGDINRRPLFVMAEHDQFGPSMLGCIVGALLDERLEQEQLVRSRVCTTLQAALEATTAPPASEGAMIWEGLLSLADQSFIAFDEIGGEIARTLAEHRVLPPESLLERFKQDYPEHYEVLSDRLPERARAFQDVKTTD